MILRCRKLLSSVLFCLLFCIIGSKASNDVAIKPKKSEAFQVEIQWNQLNSMSTSLIKEYYDEVKMRGNYLFIQKNLKFQIIYNVKNNFPVFKISNGMCSKLNTSNNSFFLSSGQPRFTLSSFYHLLDNMTYTGTNEHGPSQADVYEGNFGSVNDPSLTYSVEMYFRNITDTTSYPFCADPNNCHIPLNAVVTGHSDTLGNFSYQFTFFNFKENVEEEHFQVPQGIYCENMTTSNPLPKLPVDFSAGMETYFPQYNMEGSIKRTLYSSKKLQTLRIETDLGENAEWLEQLLPGDKPTQFLIEIIDYTTGFLYLFEPKTEICVTVKNLTDYDDSNKKPKFGDIVKFLMSDGDDDKPFMYVGKRKVRDIVCDVWINKNMDGELIEVYLKQVTSLVNGTDVYVPVYISESSQNHEEVIVLPDVEHYFFNFDDRTPGIEYFDYPDCVSEPDKKRFQVEFLDPSYIKPESKIFSAYARRQIAEVLDISPLRIQQNLIDYTNTTSGEDRIIFTATLVENLAQTTGAIILKGYKNNQEIYYDLESFMNDNKLVVKVPEPPDVDDPKTILYLAIGIRDKIFPDDIGLDSDTLRNMYKQFSNKVIIEDYDYESEDVSMYGCAKTCIKEREFECESFSYCRTKKGDCRVSRNHTDDVNELLDVKICDTYTRYYQYDYEISPGMRLGPSSEDKNFKFYEDSLETCARKCSKHLIQDIDYCEGFNIFYIAKNNVTCEYREQHVQEAADKLIPSQYWKVFSRNYLADFERHPAQKAEMLPPNVVLTLETVDKPEECARICVTSAEASGCLSFDMCQPDSQVSNTSECRILLYADSGQKPSLTNNLICDHYERIHGLPERHPSKNTTTQSTLAPTLSTPRHVRRIIRTGFTSGDMAGIAIGMLILGFIFGGLTFILIMRFKLMRIPRI